MSQVVRLFILVVISIISIYISKSAEEATWEEVKSLKGDTNVLLVDVRQPKELVDTGVLPGSINIPLNAVEDTLLKSPEDFKRTYHRDKPEKDTPIIFSCTLGIRSGKAQDIALKLGFTRVKNYVGGWQDWENHLQLNNSNV